MDIAEYKLAAKTRDASVVREPAAHSPPLVVVVDRDRIRELVLLPPIQHLCRQGIQLVEGATGPRDPVF